MANDKLEQWTALVQPNGGGWVPTPAQRLVATGPDALDFLHRMSTHAVTVDAPNAQRGFLNVFVDKRGRMVDVTHCLVVSPTEVVLFVEKDAEALRAFLDGFLFMEEAELVVDSGPCLRLLGAKALALIGEHLDEKAPEQPSSFLGPSVVRAFDVSGPNGEHIPSLLVTEGMAESLLTKLIELDPEVAEAARIAAGVPGAIGEIVDGHNPLELELHDAIDWKKGCYIGQEVISRIDNYGKQSKRLVGLTVDTAHHSAHFAVGAKVIVDGKSVGEVTSVAPIACRSAAVPAALARIKSEPLEASIHGEIASGSDGAGDLVPVTIGPRRAAQIPHD